MENKPKLLKTLKGGGIVEINKENKDFSFIAQHLFHNSPNYQINWTRDAVIPLSCFPPSVSVQ